MIKTIITEMSGPTPKHTHFKSLKTLLLAITPFGAVTWAVTQRSSPLTLRDVPSNGYKGGLTTYHLIEIVIKFIIAIVL